MKQAILLLAHGTPDTVAGVPEFLLKVMESGPVALTAVPVANVVIRRMC